MKSEVWTILHWLGLGHETMVWAVCLSIFLWIRDMARWLRGTFVFWWYLSRIWPSVTDMQHYYHARYPTDDWHLGYMFSLVCFSVGVCLVGVFPHSIGTRRDPCVRVCAPLTLAFPSLENKNRTGVTRTVTCHQQPRPTTPPPDLRRLQRVPRHEKLWNYVTCPAWENWNVFLFNWCLHSSEISDCKSL